MAARRVDTAAAEAAAKRAGTHVGQDEAPTRGSRKKCAAQTQKRDELMVLLIKSSLHGAQMKRALQAATRDTWLALLSWAPVQAATKAAKAYADAVVDEGKVHSRGRPHPHLCTSARLSSRH